MIIELYVRAICREVGASCRCWAMIIKCLFSSRLHVGGQMSSLDIVFFNLDSVQGTPVGLLHFSATVISIVENL